MTTEEKRRFVRFNVAMNAVCNKNGALKRFKISNFSREGVGVSSWDLLKEGEEIETEMMIPGDNVPVVFKGKIAWSSGAVSDSEQYKGGIKFTEINNHDRSRVLEHVYQNWIMPDNADVR
ncbi:MAG: PilZ domain-containing protein [Candidatus Omnitrophica bacterium]|nr:PilZ domain-containing protein [Candidatus Omnitrophota bacterium]